MNEAQYRLLLEEQLAYAIKQVAKCDESGSIYGPLWVKMVAMRTAQIANLPQPTITLH